jgi:hypothetical protein
MRTMLVASVPTVKGNQSIADGGLPKVIQQTIERIKPEAAYFTTDAQGRRTAYMFFDLKDSSDIPSIAEPLFNTLEATVTMTPVMNGQDLQVGLGKWMGGK